MTPNLWSFVVTAILLCLMPGPDNLFVLAQSALNGRRAGLVTTLGLCAGLVIHTTAVVLGLAALIQASPFAFAMLKFAGAAYLLYLAWLAMKQPVTPDPTANANSQGLFRRGFVMNVSNPKVSIFFLAFLPQFVDPSAGSVSTQIILLGLLFISVSLVVFSAVSILGGTLNVLLTSPRAKKILNRLSAVVYVLLAAKLAF
ncbi:LysE family translocator [Pararhizobium sp. DWP1-1-3]|uniref:LysE family translocator n=1 Tax=Pararhizobium sp. DWP1-1-3 TaxID=2804652 RepID=UPI003CEF5B74